MFGALANIVAIPLTTFVTMPLEALAMLFDLIGLGAPLWWATGKSLELLLWIAHAVAGWPGARAALADMPVAAFAMMVGGGIWLTLWSKRARLLGLLPIAIGVLVAGAASPPDLIVTGDGKHLAVRQGDGSYAILRDRAGDYVRQVLAERGGTLNELGALDGSAGASCSTDLCRATLKGRWAVVAGDGDAQPLSGRSSIVRTRVRTCRHRRQRPTAALLVPAALAESRRGVSAAHRRTGNFTRRADGDDSAAIGGRTPVGPRRAGQ